jgi:hypothetical protein
MEIDFNVYVHAFDTCSFLRLDQTHLLSLEPSLYGFEYHPPVLRKVRGGGYRPQPIHAPLSGPEPAGELDGDRLACKS